MENEHAQKVSRRQGARIIGVEFVHFRRTERPVLSSLDADLNRIESVLDTGYEATAYFENGWIPSRYGPTAGRTSRTASPARLLACSSNS